jgi:PAS domain S-box-containing protein
LSFAALFEFGRRLVRLNPPTTGLARPIRRWLPHPWTLVAVLLMVLIGALAADRPSLAVEISSRYLLALSGAMLTAVGFVRYGIRERERLGHSAVRGFFPAAAAAFALYAVAAGAIGPRAEFFPANVLNHQSVLAATGMPVQVWRAACAAVAAIAIVGMMRLFFYEARQRLDDARRRAQHYLDVAGVLLVGLDRGGRVMLANRMACEVLGYRESELLGQPWVEVCVAPADRRDAAEVFARLLDDDRSRVCSTEHRVVGRSGQERLIAWTHSAIARRRRSGSGVLSSGRDVTEQRRLEEELELAGQDIKSTPEGVLITDVRGDISLANPAFERITGYGFHELAGSRSASARATPSRASVATSS